MLAGPFFRVGDMLLRLDEIILFISRKKKQKQRKNKSRTASSFVGSIVNQHSPKVEGNERTDPVLHIKHRVKHTVKLIKAIL